MQTALLAPMTAHSDVARRTALDTATICLVLFLPTALIAFADARHDALFDAPQSEIANDAAAACSGPGSCPSGFACVNSLCVRGTGPCSNDDGCHNDAR